jgi:hypothetical protein
MSWSTTKKILFQPITVHSYEVDFQHLGHVTEKGSTIIASLYKDLEPFQTKEFTDIEEAKQWIEQNGLKSTIKVPIHKRPVQDIQPMKVRTDYSKSANMLFLYDSNGYFLHSFYNANVAKRKLNCTQKYLESIYIEDRNELGSTGTFSISKKQFRVPKAKYTINLQAHKKLKNVKNKE